MGIVLELLDHGLAASIGLFEQYDRVKPELGLQDVLELSPLRLIVTVYQEDVLSMTQPFRGFLSFKQVWLSSKSSYSGAYNGQDLLYAVVRRANEVWDQDSNLWRVLF